MPEQSPSLPHEHYNSRSYQETVRLERECVLGLSPEQVYQREAKFALKAAGVKGPGDFRDGEEIVDVACGAGNHTFQMSDELEWEIPIEGVDISGNLIEMANEKRVERMRQGIYDRVAAFTVGAMQDLGKGKPPERKVKLITNLGRSFAYLSVRKMEESLQSFYDLLEPGGKLVIQVRAIDPEESEEQEWKTEEERKKRERWEKREASIQETRQWFGVSMAQEPVPECTEPVWVMRDKERKTSCYMRFCDAENPVVATRGPDEVVDPAERAEYEPFTESKDGRDCTCWVHKGNGIRQGTGIRFLSYERVYNDANGKQTVLPPTLVIKGDLKEEFDGVRKLLLKTWFGNDAKAAEENISLVSGEGEEERVGHQVLYALVVTKPG